MSSSPPLLDAAGRPERPVSVGRDITGFKQAEIRRAAQLELGDRLSDLDDPEAMASAAAEIIGRTLGVSRAGYGTVDPARETITIAPDRNAPGVSSIAGTLWFRDLGSYIDDLTRGTAAVISDVFADPRTLAGAEALVRIGARSFINLPIFEHGAFVALFFVNYPGVRPWTPEETVFRRNLADRTRAAIVRRRAEMQLRDLAGSLEQQVAVRTLDRNRLWQSSTDVILVVRFDGAITAANPAWLTILGWSEAELIGSNLVDLVDPDHLDRTQDSTALLTQGAAVARLDNRFRHVW